MYATYHVRSQTLPLACQRWKSVDIELITLREPQQMCYNVVFELSTVIDDIYRFFQFYDIKRGGDCEIKKQTFCPHTILYELIFIFQYLLDC